MDADLPEKRLLRTAEAAELLAREPRSLLRLVRRGQIKALKIEGHFYFTMKDVSDFIDKRRKFWKG